MTWTPEQFRQLEELFFELEPLDPDQRAARLEQIRGESPELASRLFEMLEAPVADVEPTRRLQRAEKVQESTMAGQTIGHFRLLRKLGEGGMGVVYEAEQTSPVRRRVALKLIQWGADSEQVVARFDSERQALAMMEHPSIASVYEAGTSEDGRPFFAMELVDGIPLTEFCDQKSLSMEARLELFAEVCQAVQHAHRKGIIHRDLKPSNILVTESEGRPLPKVIDFGIAKAVGELGGGTFFTRQGQLLGTPEYMSPEQLDGRQLDTRSDVYSLGALLFELLVGELPLSSEALRAGGLEEIRRLVREDETPKPSERIDPTTDISRTTASQRRTDPASLARRLRGDLDWIVLKALAKERDQRYESASELAAEVGRFLAHQPVLAGPPSLRYRARKFFRRHRLGTSVAAVLVVALLVGVAGLIYGLERARKAEARAIAEARVSREVLDFFGSILAQGARSAGQGLGLTVPELFERARDRLQEDPPEDPLVLGTVLNRLAEFHHMDLEDFDQAARLFAQAEEVLHESYADSPELATAIYTQGIIDRLRGDFDRALERQNQALELRTAEFGPASEPVASVIGELAAIHRALGDSDRALAEMRRAVEITEAVVEPEHPELLSKQLNLGGMLMAFGQPEEADRLHRHVLAIAEREGLAEYQAVAHNNLGSAAYRRGQVSEAVSHLEQGLEITRTHLGADPLRLELLLSNLAMMSAKKGDYDQAAERMSQALELVGESVGLETPQAASVRQLLAEIYLKGSNYQDARRELERAIDLAYRVPPQAPAVSPLRAERNYALLDEAEGNPAAALRRLERASAQPEWAEKDPDGHCLLLLERARLSEPERATARYQNLPTACDRPGQGGRILYGRATFLAQHGGSDQALDLLEQLVDTGYRDVWPALDPALAQLRGRARFETFLERVRPR